MGGLVWTQHVYTYIHTHTCMHTCMHACMHACMHLCICMCVCTSITSLTLQPTGTGDTVDAWRESAPASPAKHPKQAHEPKHPSELRQLARERYLQRHRECRAKPRA